MHDNNNNHRKHETNLSESEKWASIIGGGALAVLGLTRRTPGGLVAALIGGGLIHRGSTGHCYVYDAFGVSKAKGQGSDTTSVPYRQGIRVDYAITVNRPRNEVYAFWRQLDNLPLFMNHLESVCIQGDQSHWVAKAPAGRTVQWDAVIHNEVKDELLAWRSLPGADVDSAGSVLFRDAPGGRGTEIRIELQYNPPAGVVGATIAKLWGEEPSQQIKSDMHRLKQLLEAGEILTTDGQSSGREAKMEQRTAKSQERTLAAASEHSFPASDAPAFNH